MDEKHLKKSASPKCELHPTQKPKYYCSDSECRTFLCLLCMRIHPKEHLPTLTTIEDVKSQTLETLKNETLNRFGKFVEAIFKSNQMNDLFKEALGTLMQQNTTVDLDDEDVVDVLADTLQRKYFEMKFTMTEKIPKNFSIEPSSTCLTAFDHKFDDHYVEDGEEHDHYAAKICKWQPGYYCREDVESFYAESKGQGIFWRTEDQTLLCKDMINREKKWKRYEIPEPFEYLTVLESKQLFLVIASEDQFTVYSIEEKSRVPLKTCKEIPQEEEILFLASDHVDHLFVVTEGENGLTANIYSLFQNQNNELELLKLISFEPFDLPKKVVFDQVNNLLFILGDDFLEIYKYPKVLTAPLQAIFKFNAGPFSWHKTTQRLLLVGSGKLYQFSKGKFRLIRVIMNHSIRPIELTNQGILCLKDETELCLLSYKNLSNQRSFVFPSVGSMMDKLQEIANENLDGFGNEVDIRIGDLEITWNTVKIVFETPEYIVISANITYYQSASQTIQYGWKDFGGTIYTQHLLKYNFRQKEDQMSTENNS